MSERLERECDVFCRCLSGAPPSEYVLRKYVAAHERGVVDPEGGSSSFERAVVALARSGPFVARALDAWSRVFANGSLLRRKMVLVLSLLEVRSPHADALDTPTGASRIAMFLGMAWLGVRFALSVVAASIALVFVRVACVFGGGK